MRIVIVLPFSDAALSDEIRRFPEVEVVKETPYYNGAVLTAIRDLVPPPDVVIVGEALPVDSTLPLLEFITGLRRDNLRVLFLADKSQPGDPFLAELVSMGVTDIVLGANVSLDDLRHMIKTPTPWAKVSYLSNVSRSNKAPAPAMELVAPKPDEAQTAPVVKEVVVIQAPRRKVVAVMSVGPDGAGVTTVAANVSAAVASTGIKTALLDGETRWPGVGNLFDLPYDHNGVAGVTAARTPQEIGAVVRENLTVFGSPVYPARPAAAGMGESDCLAILDRLQATYEQVIVDLGYQVEHPFFRTALRLATDAILVLNLDLHRIVIAKHELARMAQITALAKCKLVINGVHPEQKRLKSGDVAATLDAMKVAAELPYTPQSTEAAAQCQPLYSVLPPESPYSTEIRKLAGLSEGGSPKKGWWPFK